MERILVSESDDDWLGEIADIAIVDATDYLTNPKWSRRRDVRVCCVPRSFHYQSIGYYTSLLAEARGHRPVPSVMTVQDLSGRSAIRFLPKSLEDAIQASFESIQTDSFTLSVYFGQNLAKRHERLARELFNQFHAPLLRFTFKRRNKWRLQKATTLGSSQIPESHRAAVVQFANEYFGKHQKTRSSVKRARYDLAILHNPDEAELAPSDPAALKKFLKAATASGLAAELITKDDSGRILEFDALFIRETTAVDHHTYRLARRAEREGLVVLDDPQSILRCTNKVFLAELLEKAKVPIPKTMIVHRGNVDEVARQLGLPCVLKRPDSAFSQGVVKAKTEDELHQHLNQFFEDSELVIAQAYLPTDFDWRIGVLDGRPMFACKYHMARGHWQIAKHAEGHDPAFGKSETLPIETIPRRAVAVAIKAAGLIGDGLYGVDVKESQGEFVVIEVNDNPNLDSGVEDKLLRDDLYLRIMESFVRRIEKSKASS
jgi:glutathione synthase/RimK-type ligase-like ATP-grasp enzyme